MTPWYSYALNLPRSRSADFQISPARLSSFGLLRDIVTLELFDKVASRTGAPAFYIEFRRGEELFKIPCLKMGKNIAGISFQVSYGADTLHGPHL